MEIPKRVAIPQATRQGYIECELGGVVDLSFPNSKTRRGRVQDGGSGSPTLTAESSGVCRLEPWQDGETVIEPSVRIRKLTPRECWRLMGFDDGAFERASAVNSNSQLYKQAGNSIVVDVLMAIFQNMM